jgi:hypothetical protein
MQPISIIFDWDCTITTRHHYFFMNNYKNREWKSEIPDFVTIYGADSEYNRLNVVLQEDIRKAYNNSSVSVHRESADLIVKQILTQRHAIKTYVDILNDKFYTYIVKLFFGIPRFFALRDMFQVLYSKNIKIIILSNGIVGDIIILLKILLYGRDDIYSVIDIYAKNKEETKRELWQNDICHPTIVYTEQSIEKEVVLFTLFGQNNKILYIDDTNTYHDKFMMLIATKYSNGDNKVYNENMSRPFLSTDTGGYYEFFGGLKTNQYGLTLTDIQKICNIDSLPRHQSGGNKNDYMKLKNYSQ